MFTSISCPTCGHKFTVPEAAMGKRHICPNCKSPFVAGKSVAEAEGAMKPQTAVPAGNPNLNKTMLTGAEAAAAPPPPPPIKYKCPNCQRALEAPHAEGLVVTKKPCPHCGQRHKVPDAPPLAAVGGLNKTMLVTDTPGAPVTSVQANQPAPAPGGGHATGSQTVPGSQLPMGVQASGKTYAIMGMVAGGIILLLLLSCITVGMIMGPKGGSNDPAVAAAKAELDKLKAQIAENERVAKEAEAKKRSEDAFLQKIEQMTKAFEAQRQQDERKWKDELDRLARTTTNQKLIDEANEKFKREKDAQEGKKAELEAQRMKAERDHQEALAAQRRAQEDATRAAQNAALQQAIINASAPRYWYHPRYYYPW